ncbi:MAG: hypothetical protein K2N31_02515 [Treponemataceae bacterium]|nr:hypothetical protein [Treponemataceae bacterium]
MKRTLMLIALLAAVVSLAGAQLFNDKLSADERERLAQGEVVIRNIGKMKHICMQERKETEKLIKTMKKLDPNYTAEIIQLRPYAGNETLRDDIKAALVNIPEYAGIPYFSERHKTFYNLYDSAVITDQTVDESNTNISANLEMAPFGIINADIHIEESEDSIYYEMTNTNTLRLEDKFNAVKAENMKSAITVFRDGDNWVLYAVGGVDTFKIFFLADRVETSFINRIKTFCNFIFTKI